MKRWGHYRNFCFVLWCLERCQGIACQNNMTNDVRTPHKNRRKSTFPGDFWSLGEPWGAFGWFLGPFGPKSVFRTGEHGSLDFLWAPLADPKIDRKSFMLINTSIFFQKKCVPKQVHKQDHFLSKFCVILVIPQPCCLSSRLHGSTILQKWPDH